VVDEAAGSVTRDAGHEATQAEHQRLATPLSPPETEPSRPLYLLLPFKSRPLEHNEHPLLLASYR
jgi:hypothetical protein